MNPLSQFEIKTFVPLKLFGVDVSITNSALYMMAATGILLLFFGITLWKLKLKPSLRQSVIELPMQFLENMVKEVSGTLGLPFLPLIGAVFFFVFMGNALGLLPYGFTFTGQLIVNLTLALIIFIFSTIVGFVRQGFGYLRIFFPKDVPIIIAPILIPIEIVSYFSRPLSLSIRLFVNMLAGHSMMKVMGTFAVMMGFWGVVPLALNMIFVGFEMFIAFLQAYVFAILSCIYLNDALKEH